MVLAGELESALQITVERIRADLARKNEVRDHALERSRALIRHCANSIRATHRREFAEAQAILEQAGCAAQVMCAEARAYADVYFAGYLQDALKELAEAALTLAFVTRAPLPTPEDMGIDYPAYLNGLGEAASELRRYALDSIRRGETAEAERMMAIIDEVYSHLVTIDFPDALTANLRRTTDLVRGIAERTRGDLTTAVGQEKLQAALARAEKGWQA